MAQRVHTSTQTDTSAPVSIGLGRRILRARGAPLAALLVLGAIAFAGLAAHQTAHLRRIEADGLVVAGTTVVAADARWGGLAPGDRIVAVAGGGLEDRTVPHRFGEVPVHGPATLEAERAGERLVVPLIAEPLPLYHAASAWVRFLVGALTVLLGVVGFALRPGTRVAWLFLLFCLAVEVNLLFPLALAPWLALFPVVQALSFSLASSLGCHTFCELPRRLPAVERRPWLPALLYVPTAAIAAWAFAAPASNAPPDVAGLWSLVGCFVALGLLAAGRRAARRDGDDAVVAQFPLLVAGITIGLLVPVAVHVARSAAGIDDKWLVHVNAVPVIVYPATIAVALLRRNVLGADRHTATVVAYAATLAVVGLGGALVLIGGPLLVRGQVGASPLALVVMTAAATLAAGPIYRRLKRAVDRRFQREGVPTEVLDAHLREVVRLAALGDREAVIAGVFTALEPLGAERAALYVLDPARHALVLERGRGDGVAPTVDAAQVGATVLTATAHEDPGTPGIALAAPIAVRGVVGGVLALGPRRGATRYPPGEQSYLALLAAQVGRVLELAPDRGAIGRYRIERRIGVGGMAEVHLAWQVGPGGFERRVALKRPLPHVADDPELVAMFLDEARLAANLRHPHIAQVLEVGRDGGSYFIAMEYIDGVSLRTLLRANRRRGLPPTHAFAIADALLDALACAHDARDARGIAMQLVHRDVTPSNVLLSGDGEVKLVDFGIAHATARLHVTRAGAVKGTPRYMSPEQRGGRDLDARSDLFSAGLVLYEMLAGRAPWPDGPAAQRTAPPPIPDLDARVDGVLVRALAWDPRDRFASAPEMRAALRAAFAPLPPAPAADLAASVRAAAAAAAAEETTAADPTSPVLPDAPTVSTQPR